MASQKATVENPKKLHSQILLMTEIVLLVDNHHLPCRAAGEIRRSFG